MDKFEEFEIIFNDIYAELKSATEKFGAFNSAHEGYAIIKEEVDELWDAIKDKNLGFADQRKECIQVAAMAVRFIWDVAHKEER